MNRKLKLAFGLALICGSMVTTPSASAASGWYLLVPPRSDFNESAGYLHGFTILDTKPLSQWSQQRAYVSADECENMRTVLISTAQEFHYLSHKDYVKAVDEKISGDDLKRWRSTSESSLAYVNALAASRCIKSDDPRLGK